MEITPFTLIVALALLVILIGVLIYAAQVARTAPDAPSGPPTGQASMERKVAASVAMIAGMGLLFLGYGLKEPLREAEASERQLDVSITRGIENYTTLCFSCHGEKGQGAIVPDSNPPRLAAQLNRDSLRPTDPDERKKTYDLIFKTIQRGRAGTPMPAWGQTDGGALLDEQVNELTLMILNGDREITLNGKKETVWKHIEDDINAKVAEGLAKLPQQPTVENEPFYQALNDEQKLGVRTIVQYNCGSCHTIPNIPGAAGTIGPNLGANNGEPPIGQRKQIAGGAVPNNSVDDLAKWIQNPQALKPGTAMPTLGLSAEQAHAAAAYLYSLQGQ